MMAADVGHNRHNIAICIHFVVGYSDSPPIWSWPRRVGVGFCNFIRIEPTGLFWLMNHGTQLMMLPLVGHL
ncbi:hypothetical protein DCAR_0416318 [Daucus carota subsp. sativus]|uniref:Uncharacterized protein n=1 Tax=Daucus carota subsp. sativus TaxID=79200 RepID=A0A165XD36_DAUCS|nr:hypothetical protein DCAR_0416318 [Daucus carota subsp. sativus]